MNILARFGLAIDPKEATAGARAIIRSLKDVKGAIQEVANTPEPTKGLKAAGAAGKKAGDDIGAGMKRAKDSTTDAGNAAKNASGAFDGLIGKVMKMAAAIGVAVVAYKALSMASGFVMSSIASADQMEGFTNRWAFFLGSFDAAKAKMAELQQFANTTPFDLPGVTTAALALARLKDTGFETMKGLRMVGDAAGVAGQPIEEVGQRIARLINNLKRGGGAGDEARILGEWQVFSPELVGRLADMGTKAENFKVLLADIKKELGGASGGMLLMSTTWDGLMSTMADAWNTLKTTLGTPLIEGLKPLIMDITGQIDKMTERLKSMVPQVREFAAGVSATFRALTEDGGLQKGFAAAMEYLQGLADRLWNAWAITLKSVFERAAYEFKALLLEVNNPNFWSGVGKAMLDAANMFLSTLKAGIGPSLKAAGDDYFKTGDRLLNKFTGGLLGNSAEEQNATTAAQAAAKTAEEAAKALEWARNNPGQTVTPQNGFGADLPSSATQGWDPSLILGPAPEIKPVKLADMAVTPAIKEWTTAWGDSFNSVMGDIEKIAKDADNMVKEKKLQRDAAEGGPDGGLFPAGAPKESKTVKKPVLEETGMTWEKTVKEADKFKEKIKTPEEKLADEKTLLDGMVRLGQMSEEQKSAILAKSEAEHVASANRKAAAAKKAIETEESALTKLMKSWGDLKNQVDQAAVGIMNSIADNVTGAIVSMIDGTKTAGQAFADMAKGIVSSIVQIITKLMVQYALYSAMGMLTGGFATFATGALAGGVKHEGGEVGGGGRSRNVDAASFAGARRFHQGGMIGSNEVPIIAEKGESILTKDQTDDIKRRLSGSQEKAAPPQVTIANFTDPNEMKAALASDPSIILNMLSIHAPTVRRILNASGGAGT